MRIWMLKVRDIVSLDRIGVGLSLLCAIHCVATPFVLLLVPFLAQSYVTHPLFHLLMAFLIIPIGLTAFVAGYKHHGNWRVLLIGIPGLIAVSVVPVFLQAYLSGWMEPLLMISGSTSLVVAHGLNRRSCRCHRH